MHIQGNIPVGLMNEIYEKLEEKGIEIENFKVNADVGYIDIQTSVILSKEDIKKAFQDEGTWEEVSGYIKYILGDTDVQGVRSTLNNEMGFATLGAATTGAIIANGGVMGGLAYASGVEGTISLPLVVVVIVAVAGLYMWRARN